MSSFMYARSGGSGGTDDSSSKKYFIPYKNKLEDFVTGYKYSEESPLELEWGDASLAIATGTGSGLSTGGAVYEVALQQCRLQVDATKEDRYTMSMQFVVTSRRLDNT